MNKEQQDVLVFMREFKQTINPLPTIADEVTRALRARLILEECMELLRGLGYQLTCGDYDCEIRLGCVAPVDLIEIADGLADLDYVCKGTALACGLDMEPISAEVHRSNMSKLWTQDQIETGMKQYLGATVEDCGGGLRRLLWQGKVIKSPTYSLPNLRPIIDNQESILEQDSTKKLSL